MSKTPPSTKMSVPLLELFEDFPEEMTDREKELAFTPYRIRCALIQRRPPRHPYFWAVKEIGSGLIDDIMAFKPLPDRVRADVPKTPHMTLTLVFPERYLGIAEQQQFIHVLNNNPTVKACKLKVLDLVTSSLLIIGSMVREQIRIIRWPDDKDYEGTVK